MMPPWLLALVVLIVVSALGTYVIYSRHAGVPEGLVTREEGFDASSRSAAKACETAFSACLNDGGQSASCTTAYNTCIANITNPSVSTVDNAGTTGRSASSAVTSRGTPTSTPVDADYEQLLQMATTGKKATLSSDLLNFIKEVKGKLPGETDAEYEIRMKQDGTLTPEGKAFLEQVKGRMSFEYAKPTAANLAAAQGVDTGDKGSVIVPGGLLNDPATYKAFQQIIKPHETPVGQQPGLTANQKGADGVLAGAILTPSMRQQIRDDVRKAVGEELANIQNEYEITYDQQ